MLRFARQAVLEPVRDAAYVLARTKHCHGSYGASSMERLPTGQASVALVEALEAIGIAGESGGRTGEVAKTSEDK